MKKPELKRITDEAFRAYKEARLTAHRDFAGIAREFYSETPRGQKKRVTKYRDAAATYAKAIADASDIYLAAIKPKEE